MTVENPNAAVPGNKQDDQNHTSKKSNTKAMDTIMSSLALKRRTSGVFGSKRWWTPSCWASRSHQEAYLRKLYSKKYSNGIVNPAGVSISDEQPTSVSDNSPWKSAVYELPTTDEHYLDAFLRTRTESECPALSTPRASPTEKCVEFLTRNEARSRECIVDIHRDDQQLVPEKGTLRVTERNFDEILRNASGNTAAE